MSLTVLTGEWTVPRAKWPGSEHECLGHVGSGAAGPGHQLYRCQWPTAELPAVCPGHSRRARYSCIEGTLSPLTVPITLSVCFLTEGHKESLAEAIIKAHLDILYVRIPFYQHSLSVGLAIHLAPWIISTSQHHITGTH